MNRRIRLRAILPLCCMALAAWLAAPSLALAQQTGMVQGVVLDLSTQQPVAGADVYIQGTQLRVATNAQGRFMMVSVPPGTHRLVVELIGYTTATREITVVAGQTVTANFSLEPTALQLQEIVVTGVSGGAMERAKVPFIVTRVDESQMPVQAMNPVSQIQGRVPGANIAMISGRPGEAPTIMLRGPTSINASGRGQEPLYIVDGVVLNGSIADINPADIESIEIVKGAAASTLYGSRAAAGVISITTKMGREEGARFTARMEYGVNDIERDFGIARYHPFLMDETGTRFCVLDAYGSNTVCSRTIDYLAEQKRINENVGDFALAPPSFPVDPGAALSGPQNRRVFLTNDWPGTKYNAVAQIVDPKPQLLSDFRVQGRSGSTTYMSSFGYAKQGGAIMGLKGYERMTWRVNLGQRIGDDWHLDARAHISRSESDGVNQQEGGTGFFRLTRTPAIVDITRRDANGRLYIRTNLGSGGVQNENPLYSFENIAREDVMWRVLGGAKLRYTPAPWFEANGDFNIDRQNYNFRQFHNKGFRTTNSNPGTNNGLIFNGVNNSQSINSSLGAMIRPNLLDQVVTRFEARWLFEEQRGDNRSLQGNQLRVADVWAASNATNLQNISSSENVTRQMSGYLGGTFEVLDRYTLDLAVRRDGNSRFGEENRWQTYGRASFGWLMAREEWFPSDFLTTFTLRASYGTAGRAPSFSAQYETYSIGSGGTLSAVTQGNPKLRPEVTRELEVSAEIGILNRAQLQVAYANALTTDQILPVPVPVATGFPQQWQNAGSLRNKTLEGALSLPIVQGQNFSWMATATYTRTRTTIEELNVAPFFIGTSLQATDQFIRIAEGEEFGTIYGRKFMRSCSELPADWQSRCGPGKDFQLNDEGWLVWVGAGNNPGMGITDNLWNAVLPEDESPWPGVPLSWGMPVLIRDETGTPMSLPLGNALPDYQVGMSHTLSYGKFTLYALIDGSFGRDVWNQGRHWSYLDFLSRDIDQAGKSVETAKPIGYFYRAGPGPGGNPNGIGGFYDILGPNNRFVEDASFIKLRELQASYQIGRLAGFGDWSVSVVGRNLKTWTDYSGFDPEVGIGSSGGAAGNGIINAIDAFTFPQLRSVSFVISTTF